MLGKERVYKHEMVNIYTAVSFDVMFYFLTFITLSSNIRKARLLHYDSINLGRKKRNASASVKTLQILLCCLFQYIIIF
jgi:hypothetical protein